VKLTDDSDVILCQLRNPWGSHEWNGDWCDGHVNWQRVDPKDRNRLGVSVSTQDNAHDGIFFMTYEDFVEHFDSISVTTKSLPKKRNPRANAMAD